MSITARVIFCVMALVVSAGPGFAQAPSGFIFPPIGYTTANLPRSATDGQMARVIDGDAKGSLIFWDASTKKWRCYAETVGMLNIACPPYNATVAAADNSLAIQAALDEMKAKIGVSPTRYIYVPGGEYKVTTTGLDYSPTGFNVSFIMRGTYGGVSSRIRFLNTGAYGLRIQKNGGPLGNHISIENVGFRGSGPKTIVQIRNVAQIRISRVWVQNFSTFGIDISGNSSHGVLSDGICISDNSHANPAGCLSFDSSSTMTVTGWQVENAGGATNAYFIIFRAGTSGATRDFLIASNSGRTNVGGLLKVTGRPGQIHGVKITGNSFEDIEGSGIDWGAGGSVLGYGNVIASNTLTHAGSPAAGERCIRVRGTTGVVVRDNYCKGFDIGLESQNNIGPFWVNNTLEDIKGDCVRFWNGDSSGVWRDTRFVGACGGKMLNVSNGATSGHNVWEGAWFLNAAARTMGMDMTATNLSSSDRILLADGQQTISIADNLTGSSVATGTLTPYYYGGLVDCNDPDGCDTTLSETDAWPGMRVSIRLATSPGTTNRISGDGGMTWDTITIDDVFTYERQNSKWKKTN